MNDNCRPCTMMHLLVVFFILIVFNFCYGEEYFEESLIMEPFNNEQLYMVYNFSTVSSNLDLFEDHHYDLFPRNFGELLRKYNVAEFYLSMTQGLWRYEKWSYPHFPAPPGAQLWVWFKPSAVSVDDSWRGFTNTLSGLLCASLNFISKKETVSPKLSFRPEGVVEDDSRSLVRYAVLPRENLCTENLTPWLKSLPCGSYSGIARLLNPAGLHHSQFLSLGLHFKRSCREGSECQRPTLHLEQMVSVVHDLRTSTRQKPDFSLDKFVKKRVTGACPLSTSSLIKLVVPEDTTIEPTPKYTTEKFAIYDLIQQKHITNIKVTWKSAPGYTKPAPPPLVPHCHQTGYGHQDGGIHCRLLNAATSNITVVVMQTIPWFLHVHLHSLEIKDKAGRKIAMELLTFEPARIRESSHFVEFVITVPASSTAEIMMQFTRGFLTWTEHPPDAHHGFYVGSTVVTVKSADIDKEEGDVTVHRLYTETLLVSIPVPDFSMPYNVICLACTVIAIAFGSLHNLTTRRFTKIDPDSQNDTFLKKVLSFCKKKFGKTHVPNKEKKQNQDEPGKDLTS